MPFASLSPAKQKFLSSYFKPKTFFKKGTSDEKKDEMADKLIAFNKARDVAAQQITRLVPSGVDISALTAELKAADAIAADPKSMRADEAKAVIEGLVPKIKKVSDDFCAAQKKRAADAIVLVKTYIGMALDIPKLEARNDKLVADCGKDPIDYAAVKTSADVIVAKEAELKIRSVAYKANWDFVKNRIKTKCEDKLPSISDDIVKDRKKNVDADIALAHTKLDENSAFLANKIAINVELEINSILKVIKERDDYLLIKNPADIEAKKLLDKRNPGVESDCKLIEADQIKAKGYEDAKNYFDAALIMQSIAKRVIEFLPVADAYVGYETAAKAAVAAIEEFKKHPQFQYVQPDYLAIMAQFEAAQSMAGEFKYSKAAIRMEGLPAAIKAITDKAAKAAPFDELAAKATTGDPKELLVDAKKLLAELKAHPGAAIAPEVLKDGENKINALEALPSVEFELIAKASIAIIISLLIDTRKMLGVVNMYYSRADRLGEKVKALRSTSPHALYIKSHLDKIDVLVKEVKASAIKGEEGLDAKLTDGEAQFEEASRLASAEEVYRLNRSDIEAKIKEIRKDSVDFPDKVKTLEKIDAHMTAANEHSKTFNHLKAGGTLKMVEALLLVVTIGTKAKAGTPPSPDNIKKLMAQPDGQKILDDMIKALSGAAQQDVLITVLEARFGMDVKLFATEAARDSGTEKTGGALDVPAPKLMQYYEMLKGVPDSHTKLNPSMARWDQIEDGSGSFYSGSSGSVVMGCFTGMDLPGNTLNAPSQLDDIEEDSKARTDTPNPTYGTWTTMHEIGHAVDDRQGFMDKNGKLDAYGGWTNYGRNITPIAKVVSKHFEYENSYVERKLAGGNPDIPEIPQKLVDDKGAGAAADWTKRRTDFEAWFAGVRSTTNIWKNASECKKWAIGGIVYHEAYPTRWVSYKLAARSKGVTGYQFRAPGEWFSELYAAYHTNKLKDTHPAVKWLATL